MSAAGATDPQPTKRIILYPFPPQISTFPLENSPKCAILPKHAKEPGLGAGRPPPRRQFLECASPLAPCLVGEGGKPVGVGPLFPKEGPTQSNVQSRRTPGRPHRLLLFLRFMHLNQFRPAHPITAPSSTPHHPPKNDNSPPMRKNRNNPAYQNKPNPLNMLPHPHFPRIKSRHLANDKSAPTRAIPDLGISPPNPWNIRVEHSQIPPKRNCAAFAQFA